jgi:hypothetical protein
MSLSRWWREWQFERAYQQSARADLQRIGKAYKAQFKQAATGNDFDAVMASYLKECRLPDLRLETLRSRQLRRRADRYGIELPREWWTHDEEYDLWSLTADGRRQLTRHITQERIWGTKQWFQVLTPVVALLVGLIGAVIGLLGMWRWPR